MFWTCIEEGQRIYPSRAAEVETAKQEAYERTKEKICGCIEREDMKVAVVSEEDAEDRWKFILNVTVCFTDTTTLQPNEWLIE